MSDDESTDVDVAIEVDEVREAQLATLGSEFGDAIIESHLIPGDDLWVRVAREAWVEVGMTLRHGLGFSYFNFLSAIDWMPSPFGRDMDSQVDISLHGADEKDPPEMEWGHAGGSTRFQLFARVNDIRSARGVTLKVDLPDDDLRVDTWIPAYPGANWHEREAAEMFGIEFVGHPNPRNLYLPGAFEGHPMRKDFALLARRIKPWPGIVDVEPMPGDDDDETGDAEDTA
ncbi:MAG: NADH-quinone oxidoreductase subunit C [Acidimicrobiales bacterium]